MPFLTLSLPSSECIPDVNRKENRSEHLLQTPLRAKHQLTISNHKRSNLHILSQSAHLSKLFVCTDVIHENDVVDKLYQRVAHAIFVSATGRKAELGSVIREMVISDWQKSKVLAIKVAIFPNLSRSNLCSFFLAAGSADFESSPLPSVWMSCLSNLARRRGKLEVSPTVATEPLKTGNWMEVSEVESGAMNSKASAYVRVCHVVQLIFLSSDQTWRIEFRS